MASEGGKRVTTDDALSYLKEIKAVFKEEREKYDYFLHIMKDFKDQRIDTNGVIAAAKELFKGHDELLLGLNNFVPKGYEIQLPLMNEPPTKAVVRGIEDAIDFKNKVKARFEGNRHVYKSFLDIMNKLGEGEKSIAEAHQEIAALFEGHTDLLQELAHFLPSASSGAAST